MSEVIVRMEKVPKNCDDSCWGFLSGECPWSDHVDGYTMNGGRPRNCPIKGVLPEERGDLIDRDVVYKQIQLWKSTATDTITLGFLYHIEKLLMSARLIIAEERKDDEH